MRDATKAAKHYGRGSSPLTMLLRLVFWSAAALLAWALARRSITLGDEGYMLSQAADLVAGKVPYRDFDLFVTPAVWYLNAAIFKIAGPSVIATRVAAALCLVATMAVSKRIVDEATGHAGCDASDALPAPAGETWGYGTAALVGVFAVWAFPAWTISFYSPYAVLAAMAALACTLTAMRTGDAMWHIACGVLLGVAIAFKQNYGVLATAGCGLALLVDALAGSLRGRLGPTRNAATGAPQHDPQNDPQNEPARGGPGDAAGNLLSACARIAAGLAFVVVPGVLFLAVQGALGDAVESLVVRPFHGFLDAHSIRYLAPGDLWRRTQVWTSGGLLYMAVPMTRASVLGGWSPTMLQAAAGLHVALYWLPWITFAAAGLHGAAHATRGGAHDRALVATAVFAPVFFLGVFPRADFNHLINVYQPVLALLAALAARVFGGGRYRSNAALRLAAAGSVLVLGCTTAIAAIWLRDIVGSMAFELDSQRAGVLVDETDARVLNYEIALLRAKTGEGEAVFALPGLSMVPFLAERPMPTRYYNYQSVHVAHDAGRSAAEEIERSGARLLLTHTFNFFADPVGLLSYAPELADSVTRHFRPTLAIAGRTYQLLERRDVALEPSSREWLWPRCEIPTDPKSDQSIREELLTKTLYQSFALHAASPAAAATGAGSPAEIVTRCRIEVPAGARLRIAADLRQPAPATNADAVSAELWLIAEGQSPRRLLREEWTLATEPLLSRTAGGEFELDLSGEAGKTVTLELRSRLEGPLPPSPGDFHGLTVTWSGGRIERAIAENGD